MPMSIYALKRRRDALLQRERSILRREEEIKKKELELEQLEIAIVKELEDQDELSNTNSFILGSEFRIRTTHF